MAYRSDGTAPGQTRLKTLDSTGTVITGTRTFSAEEVGSQPDIFLRNGNSITSLREPVGQRFVPTSNSHQATTPVKQV